MGDSTSEGGPDEGADIIDLSARKAIKEALEKKAILDKAPENPPDAPRDELSRDRAQTRGKSLRVIRLKPPGPVDLRAKLSGPVRITLDASIRKNKRRARLLAEAKTSINQGLHPDMQKPITVIARGKVSERQPQALADRDEHIRRRGQIRLYPVFLLNQDEVEHHEDRWSLGAAADGLAAIESRIRESNPDTDADRNPRISPDLFNDVALVLLKYIGSNFNGLLNDERVESACRLILCSATCAKIKSFLDYIRKTPVN